MKRIYLHGFLKEKYGEYHDFDVESPAMLIRAMSSQFKQFPVDVRDNKFVLIRGDKDKGDSIGADVMRLKFGHDSEFHLIPAVQGAGGRAGSIIKIVVGVALLAVGVGGAILAAGAAGGLAAGFAAGAGVFGSLGVTWGGIAATGLAITLAGVSAALTRRPDIGGGGYSLRERPDDRPSFLFTAPKNRSEQGMPIPVVYGRMRVGSIVVSTGLTTEAI